MCIDDIVYYVFHSILSRQTFANILIENCESIDLKEIEIHTRECIYKSIFESVKF